MSALFLLPTFIAEGKIETLPAYILPTVKKCQVLFVENERTARRYLKLLDRAIEISDFEWHEIHKAEDDLAETFKKAILQQKRIGIISESGCPGVADPGQKLIALAQNANYTIVPLVGPNSILLSLMGSGLNGQQFEFTGYLPVEPDKRKKRLLQLEADSAKQNSTKIFIETPYRNNQIIASVLEVCQPGTKFCIAYDLTGDAEMIKTKTIKDWRSKKPELGKTPAIFLLYAGT